MTTSDRLAEVEETLAGPCPEKRAERKQNNAALSCLGLLATTEVE